MAGIVWLASYPKSGNTWVRYFLNVMLETQSQGLNNLAAFSAGDASADWYRPLLRRPLAEASYEEIAKVRPFAIRRMASSRNGLVFMKTHNALVAHSGTAMIDTSLTAGAIYIIRNPLDVVISLAAFLGAPLEDAIDELLRDGATVPSTERFAYQYFGSWAEHVESWTRRPIRQLHVMRYEDMLEKPQETFGLLAQFLRLGVSAEDVAAAIAASSFENLRTEEAEGGFAERPHTTDRFFRAGREGQWRDVLNQSQVERIVAASEPQMARFGYWPA